MNLRGLVYGAGAAWNMRTIETAVASATMAIAMHAAMGQQPRPLSPRETIERALSLTDGLSLTSDAEAARITEAIKSRPHLYAAAIRSALKVPDHSAVNDFGRVRDRISRALSLAELAGREHVGEGVQSLFDQIARRLRGLRTAAAHRPSPSEPPDATFQALAFLRNRVLDAMARMIDPHAVRIVLHSVETEDGPGRAVMTRYLCAIARTSPSLAHRLARMRENPNSKLHGDLQVRVLLLDLKAAEQAQVERLRTGPPRKSIEEMRQDMQRMTPEEVVNSALGGRHGLLCREDTEALIVEFTTDPARYAAVINRMLALPDDDKTLDDDRIHGVLYIAALLGPDYTRDALRRVFDRAHPRVLEWTARNPVRNGAIQFPGESPFSEYFHMRTQAMRILAGFGDDYAVEMVLSAIGKDRPGRTVLLEYLCTLAKRHSALADRLYAALHDPRSPCFGDPQLIHALKEIRGPEFQPPDGQVLFSGDPYEVIKRLIAHRGDEANLDPECRAVLHGMHQRADRYAPAVIHFLKLPDDPTAAPDLSLHESTRALHLAQRIGPAAMRVAVYDAFDKCFKFTEFHRARAGRDSPRVRDPADVRYALYFNFRNATLALFAQWNDPSAVHRSFGTILRERGPGRAYAIRYLAAIARTDHAVAGRLRRLAGDPTSSLFRDPLVLEALKNLDNPPAQRKGAARPPS